MFGPTNSGNAMAWKHIPNQKKIPVIGNVASATDITKPMSAGADNYMFRVSMVDREQISALMAYVKKNPAAKKIGFMAETTGYGQGGPEGHAGNRQLYGIKPATTEKFGVNDTDMTSQLNKIKAAGVDTVLVWAQGTPIGQLVRSKQKIDYFPQTITSWAADNNSFLDAAGKELAEQTAVPADDLPRADAEAAAALRSPFVARYPRPAPSASRLMPTTQPCWSCTQSSRRGRRTAPRFARRSRTSRPLTMDT